MDHLMSFVLVNEFFVSCLFGNNLKETLFWIVIVYLSALSWKFLNLVCCLSSVDEHDIESSIYFTELLTLSNAVIRPKTIRVVDSMHLVDDAVDLLIRNTEEFPVLGMDCEMKSRVGQSPAIHLLQFSTEDGQCVLFRITFMPHLPSSLSRLLSNDDIWKVGIGVYNDALYLLNQYPNQFQIKGTFDVRYLAHFFGIPERGLKNLAAKLLQADLNLHQSKGAWSDIELTPDRIMYAAIDAYLGILLFKKFFQMYVDKTFVGEELNDTNQRRYLDLFLEKWKHKKSRQFRDDY